MCGQTVESVCASPPGGVVVTKIVRTSKRSTKSSVEQIESLLPVEDASVPEPAEEQQNSFIYSPSRRRTRGELCLPVNYRECVHPAVMVLTLCCVMRPSASRAESPGPSEEPAVPGTRSKRKVVQEASDAPHVSALCSLKDSTSTVRH